MSKVFIVVFIILVLLSLLGFVWLVKEAIAKRFWTWAVTLVAFWLLVLGA